MNTHRRVADNAPAASSARVGAAKTAARFATSAAEPVPLPGAPAATVALVEEEIQHEEHPTIDVAEALESSSSATNASTDACVDVDIEEQRDKDLFTRLPAAVKVTGGNRSIFSQTLKACLSI